MCYNNNASSEFRENLVKHNLTLLGDDPGLFDVLTLLAGDKFADTTPESQQAEFAKCVKELKDLTAREERQKLIDDLRLAERDGNETRVGEIARQINELI
jgi:hypothetical protein